MTNQELIDYFKYRCEKGFTQRGLDKLSSEQQKVYRDRLEYEVEVIIDFGFAGYFLIVEDILNFARENKIPAGPGRGSIGGSLVGYCLEITQVDPIQYNLIFERFLNPGRIGGGGGLCDIDLDFSREHREQIIEYIENKYGTDSVVRIGTFGTMRAKNAIKNVARALGHPYEVGEYLSKLLLPSKHGKPRPLSESIEKVPDLQDHYNKQGAYGEVLHWAEKFEGLVNSVGVHAAGIVISDTPVTSNIPVFIGRGGEITAQWEMNNLENLGYVKFDILGLDTLTRIYYCLKSIKDRHNIDLDIDNIDREDQTVYEALRQGNVLGIFQLETNPGMRDLVVQVRPTRLEDLSAIIASFRPGPLQSTGLNDYLAVRSGKKEPEYLVPELEPILRDTSGYLIYQEQALNIAKELAGYDLKNADLLRRAIGKKKQEEMAEHENKFKEGCEGNNLPADKVNILWEQIKAHADYSFNAAHSLEYSLIAYQTAWLKTYYPLEWMCAVMTCENDKDQMIRYIAECKRLGILISPPDINKSNREFTIDGDSIVFGLAPIKNIGEGPVTNILEEKELNGKYTNFLDFLKRVNLSKVNRLKVESLVKAGAFDSIAPNRKSLLVAAEKYWEYRKQLKSFESKLITYMNRKEKAKQRLNNIEAGVLSDKGRPLKPLKNPPYPEEPETPTIIHLEETDQEQLLEDEHTLLGYYITEHPLDSYEIDDRLMSVEQIRQLTDNGEVSLVVIVSSMIERITKKKQQKMASLVLEDKTGYIDAVAFPKTYERYKKYFEERKPLMIYGYLDVIQGEETNISKIKVGKVQELSKIVPRIEKKKDEIQDLRVKIDELEAILPYLKSEKNGSIRVRLVGIGESGVEVSFPRIFNMNKISLNKIKEQHNG
jgi:DNA polymerase-3 subunit alpha